MTLSAKTCQEQLTLARAALASREPRPTHVTAVCTERVAAWERKLLAAEVKEQGDAVDAAIVSERA